MLFWRQLADANLIDGSYGAGTYITQSNGDVTNPSEMNLYFPQTKIDSSVYWVVSIDDNTKIHYYGLSSGSMGGALTSLRSNSGGLTPSVAYNIDVKLDDGLPNTGTVQARANNNIAGTSVFDNLDSNNASANNLAVAEASGDCTVTPASVGIADELSLLNTYSIGSVAGNVAACLLRLKF